MNENAPFPYTEDQLTVGERENETATEKVTRIMGIIGLEAQDELVYLYTPMRKDGETAEWKPELNPATGNPKLETALLPLDRIDDCPAPLDKMPRVDLAEWLAMSEERRANKIDARALTMAEKFKDSPDYELKKQGALEYVKKKAREAGRKLLDQSAQMRNERE